MNKCKLIEVNQRGRYLSGELCKFKWRNFPDLAEVNTSSSIYINQ